MEHWQVTYLGIRKIPRDLTEFDLATFFTFSVKERALIEARRGDLYRLAVALHIGFIRMSGRTLDAYKQVPKVLWNHLGAQLELDPPDLGTPRTLYETRARTLIDHQFLAYQALGFRPMAEHQRRYVVRWLKERLTGRPERGDLLYELKRWLYEHHILIVHDQLLKRLIVKAGQDVEGSLTEGLTGAFGDATLDHWSWLLAQPDNDHASLQQWLWSVPLRQSTHQMGEVFTKIDRFYAIGVHEGWPTLCNDAAVRHYARRCARRSPSISKRVEQRSRRLEAACFMRYALCSATDQLLSMLRRWIRKVVNDATREVESIALDPNARLREFASAVKTVALDAAFTREELSMRVCELADQALGQRAPRRRSLVRARLLAKRGQARAMLSRLIHLPFEAQTVHPVISAIEVLRELYARKGYLLPDRVVIRLGRAWREAIDSYDRYKALLAFEWATLFALRAALRNGSVFIDHSFAFRSQAMLLIPPDEWKAKRNHFYGHLKLRQDPKEFLGPLIEHLDRSLIVLRDATTRGDVRIDSAVHLDPLSAQTPNPALDALRRAIFSACPDGQLPEIILEVDSTTRFSWLLLGREPGSRAELLMVYAAVLAHGTSLTAADIARMVPELVSAAIRQMMNRIADDLIDDFTNAAFRAELRHVLNRGEAVHTVQRAIHIGKIPLELTRDNDSLAAVSSALALLSNAVMAWNTIHMQRAVDQIEAMSGESVQASDLRRISKVSTCAERSISRSNAMHVICCERRRPECEAATASLNRSDLHRRAATRVPSDGREASGTSTRENFGGSIKNGGGQTGRQEVSDLVRYFYGATSQTRIKPRSTYRRKMH